jgi:uncharacterized C2H2 Zn-finger protein
LTLTPHREKGQIVSICSVLSDLKIVCLSCGSKVDLLTVQFGKTRSGTILPMCPKCDEHLHFGNRRSKDFDGRSIKKATLSLVNELRATGKQASERALAVLPPMEVS